MEQLPVILIGQLGNFVLFNVVTRTNALQVAKCMHKCLLSESLFAIMSRLISDTRQIDEFHFSLLIS